jgi:hypothetical protein
MDRERDRDRHREKDREGRKEGRKEGRRMTVGGTFTDLHHMLPLHVVFIS